MEKGIKAIQLARRFAPSDWGGTETVVLETSKRLIAAGHRTEIFCTTATAHESEENVGGVLVHRFPYFYPYIGLSRKKRNQLDRKGGSPFSFQLMRALFKVPSPDLIHLHTVGRIGGIGRYVAQRRRIPYVVSLHGGLLDVPKEEAESWTRPVKGTFEWGKVLGWWVGSRRVLDDAAAILCVGHQEKMLVQEKYPNKRVVHVPNGVDKERFARGDGLSFRQKHGIPVDAFVILTVARIDAQKNQQLPVQLLPHLRNVHPKAHLLFIGNITNPSYHNTLMQTARTFGMEINMTIVPGVPSDSPELVDAYHAADVFLLPSVHEPFGIVILEAWAAERPVIASYVGGVRQLVENGHDALTFESGSERSLVKAFEEMVQKPEYAKCLARNGLRKAREKYDWEKITGSLIDIYGDVISTYPVTK